MSALVLTYHAVESGPPPLRFDPAALERHLDRIVASGAQVLTVGELADRLRARRLPERALAITFDDGYASVPREAAPLLERRGLVATVFCVARRLGRASDWPTRAPSAPALPLASSEELRGLAAAGWEIGSHGLDHDPLRDPAELSASREELELAVEVAVRSFAFPYGFVPPGAGPALSEAGYEAACTTRLGRVGPEDDPLELPRVDAHYLRSPRLLAAALEGRLDLYLRARGVGARARRLVRSDYAS